MSGTLCVTVRPGLSTLHVNWRHSSMWSSVLQRPVSAQSVPHRDQVLPIPMPLYRSSLTSASMINPGYCWSLLKTQGEKHFYSNIPPPCTSLGEVKQRDRWCHLDFFNKKKEVSITAESSQTAGEEFHLLCFNAVNAPVKLFMIGYDLHHERS